MAVVGYTAPFSFISVCTLHSTYCELKDGDDDSYDDNDGNIVSSEKASLLNSYFASVGVIDDGLIPCCDSMNTECILDTAEFSASNVLTALGKLKGNLSSGPDGLPPLFLSV